MTFHALRSCMLIGLFGWAAAACSSKTTDLGSPSEPSATAGQGASIDPNAGGGGGLNLNPGNNAGDAMTHPTLAACPTCQWVDCPAGSPTTVSGIVRTPAKSNADPLYNAVVYIPSSAVEAFSVGVSCDHCGNVSGNPVAATLSGTDGKFVLDGPPVGQNVPLVLQLGRWRRQVVMPEIKACVDNPLPPELTRFPRNKSEGDIPAMGLVSSGYDPEECILRKIGIDDSEFTVPSEAGRIHVFSGLGATLGSGSQSASPDGWSLWGNPDELKRYDLVILPCTSTPEDVYGSGEGGKRASQAARAAVAAYANAGGRVFATDLSYTWITEPSSPFAATASWVPDPSQDEPYDVLQATIDTGFPKGKALGDWLVGIGATVQPESIELKETYRRSLAVNAPTQRWLYSTDPASLQTFTFNTPLDAAADLQCGRVLYSSFHIAGAGSTAPDGDPAEGTPFPMECDDAPLTAQERLLEFMLFDLASCVQIDTQTPLPPEIIR
ncbi:MAG TPA: hypothetical protein VHW01_01760 [Polyangiaceae bacterium]|jgi:hypothetical protein|nr:hypothetical protein [Polyangiaceae bacterium]